jgi:hypothetical protein
MHVCHVADLFATTHGVVILTDKSCREWPRGLVLKIGQPIELRMSGSCVLQSRIAGIDSGRGTKPSAFLLPIVVEKEDVPIGAEVRIGPSAI